MRCRKRVPSSLAFLIARYRAPKIGVLSERQLDAADNSAAYSEGSKLVQRLRKRYAQILLSFARLLTSISSVVSHSELLPTPKVSDSL